MKVNDLQSYLYTLPPSTDLFKELDRLKHNLNEYSGEGYLSAKEWNRSIETTKDILVELIKPPF